MIVFDTETTGLIEPEATPLKDQPYIIELYAAKLDYESLEVKDDIEILIKPPIPLSPKITEITGLTDNDLKASLPFAAHLKNIIDFFIGTEIVAAHNLSYDIGMLKLELMRMDRLTRFPWPPIHFCTMENTKDFTGKWLKQELLYEHFFGKNPSQKHRAKSDVGELILILRELRKMGRI